MQSELALSKNTRCSRVRRVAVERALARGEHTVYVTNPSDCSCRFSPTSKIFFNPGWRCEFCLAEAPGEPPDVDDATLKARVLQSALEGSYSLRINRTSSEDRSEDSSMSATNNATAPAPQPAPSVDHIISTVLQVLNMSTVALAFVPGLSPQVATTITQALKDLQQLYMDYKANPTADVFDKLETLLGEVVQDVKGILHP